jgi:hypothetical protein
MDNKVKILTIVFVLLMGTVLFAGCLNSGTPATISYDPEKQPSVIPLKELTAQSPEAASGIFMTNQVINTTGGTGSPYIGQLVSLSGTTWIAADSTTAAGLRGKLGIVIKAPTTNVSKNGQVLLVGVVRNSTWSLTQGAIYYANTTPGMFSTVKSADAAVIQPVGWGYNTTVLYFNPAINASANGI